MNLVDVASDICANLEGGESDKEIESIVTRIAKKHNVYDILTLNKTVNFQIITREPCDEEVAQIRKFYCQNKELMDQYLPGSMEYYRSKYPQEAFAIFAMDVNYFASSYIYDAIRQALRQKHSTLVKFRPNSLEIHA